MKIQDLILTLQDVQRQKGNIEVAWYNRMDYWWYTRVKLELVEGKPHVDKDSKHIICPTNEKWTRGYQSKFDRQDKVELLEIRGE